MRINRELEAKIVLKPRIREGLNLELGTFNLRDSSVSVHNVHFMVYVPLILVVSSVFVSYPLSKLTPAL